MSTSAADIRVEISTIRPEDRRRERRYNIPNPPRVELRIPPQSHAIAADVVNISRNGIGLISHIYIAPGLQIMFLFGDQYVFARVRHCKRLENGFAIGASIRDVVLSH